MHGRADRPRGDRRRARTSGSPRRSRSATHYEVRAAFKSANNLRPGSPVRIAGVDGRQGHRGRAGRARRVGALVTMRIEDEGRPIHKDAHVHDPPADLPRGQLLRRRRAGHARRRPCSTTATSFPVNQTAHAGAARPDPHRAAVRHARGPARRCCDEYGRRAARPGARGFNRSIRVLEARLPRLGDRRRRDARRARARPVGLRARRAARRPRRSTATPAQLKSLITDFNVTARRVRARGGAPASARSPSCRGRCAPRSPRSARSTRRSRRCAASPRDLRPGVRAPTGPAIDASRAARRAAARRWSPSPSCAGLARDLRPTVPALARLTRRHRAAPARGAPRSPRCQNEVVLPWARRQGRRPELPGERARLPGGRQGAARARRREPLGRRQRPVVPRAARRAATNLVPLAARAVLRARPLPIEGVNPPKPPGRPPLRPDVPCETQQTPDLRSQPAAPPPPQRLRSDSTDAGAASARARAGARRLARAPAQGTRASTRS